jgi:DNA-directed RNA polymerase subunit RPC12/RpoP
LQIDGEKIVPNQGNKVEVETRCKKCRRLFFTGELTEVNIEIKCPKCGYVQKILKKGKNKT